MTSTRIGIIAMAVGWLCTTAGSQPSRAADCLAGSQQTLSGTLNQPIDDNSGGWIDIPVNVGPCNVATLRGRGKVPAGCGLGKRFTATGTIQAGSLGAGLSVASIRCS